MTPTGKLPPGAKLERSDWSVQLSVAVGGVHEAVAVTPVVAVAVIFAGHPVMTGLMESTKHGLETVTTKLQVLLFPFASEAP